MFGSLDATVDKLVKFFVVFTIVDVSHNNF